MREEKYEKGLQLPSKPDQPQAKFPERRRALQTPSARPPATKDRLISTVSLQHPPLQVSAAISTTVHYPPNHGHHHPSVPVLSDSNAPSSLHRLTGHHMPKTPAN